MRKVCAFLCSIATAVLMTGCGSAMPDLTQEETNLISEYAVGVLLKYDKNYSSRLVDTTEYDIVEAETPEEIPEEIPEEQPEDTPEQEEVPANDTEVVDISQDEGTAVPVTIEEYYGIQDFTFQYTGYELARDYSPDASDNGFFFAMDATDGMQLLVLKFVAVNNSTADQTLNMLERGARFRVSVNGEPGKGALPTMLLNDMQKYNEVVPAGSGVELVSIIEIPQSMSVGTIKFILRGGDENATMVLQ